MFSSSSHGYTVEGLDVFDVRKLKPWMSFSIEGVSLVKLGMTEDTVSTSC